MWESLEASMELNGSEVDCDCPGPPPEFRLPPPPRPPFLQEPHCSENALSEFETCDAVPVIDAEFHSSPALPSVAVIAVCSIVLLVMVLLVSVLVWKHKRKMQNFLPCKNSPQNHCDVSGANAVIYEDLTSTHLRANHLPTVAPPSIEMMDVKQRSAVPLPVLQHYGAGFPPHLLGNASVFICPPPRIDPYAEQELYNPVYEELSNGSECRGSDSDQGDQGRVRTGSEDEFAEDELSLAGDLAHRVVGPTPPPASTLPSRLRSKNSSLAGSTGNDLCRDLDSSDADDRLKTSETDSFLALRMANCRNMSLPPGRRTQQAAGRRPKSLDRRRHRGSPRSRKPHASPPPPPGLEPAAFHAGLLLQDAGGRSPAASPAYHLPYNSFYVRSSNPYETVLNRPPELTSFRPPLPPQNPPKNSSSQDSFNSDSGFSNHTTSGGRATSSGGASSTRGRTGELYDLRHPLPPLLS
ncbi:uncharacterized protein LOC132195391 isoform X2 [Neocloeon triangulifer]|nr:uncharacterized protein LOC132195391 isoform X2 [Neocloeon triangulifer]XP_059473329.1 uncharacterized protein LOC132195391 isoform X2 [Neocloeon triangulifer]XP_059473330.1 uncharacterized protein LOC132195391 isoform X2 [Neocloeon triangulifer]